MDYPEIRTREANGSWVIPAEYVKALYEMAGIREGEPPADIPLILHSDRCKETVE